jgi:hypothetical protein
MEPLPLRLRIYLTIFSIVVLGGAIGMMVIEHLSPVDAFYFIVVTLSTVGYGDISPITPVGKLLVMVIILAGVSCFLGLAADVVKFIIERCERDKTLAKLNMFIGIFYSEVGTRLLRKFSGHDGGIDKIRKALLISNTWSDEDFKKAHALLKDHSFKLDSHSLPLEDLHSFLSHHKGFMLALLENP